MTVCSVPLAELVEDLSLYPRHVVDDTHVSSLVLALKSGASLPPLVADKKSKRLVDGWHRLRAYRRVVGDTAAVDVELRSYKDEAQMLLDAVALNATHGRRLDRVDQVRVVMLAERVGITEQQVATVLHVPVDRVKTLRVRVAVVPHGTITAIPGTNTVALKRPVAHMAGQTLTKAQAVAQRTVPGTSYLLIVRQLSDGIKHRLINQEDERLLAELDNLHTMLGEYLDHVAA